MAKPKRLTDTDLAERILSYRAHRAAEKAEKELGDGDRDVIIAEAKARKLDVLVVAGMRVSVSSTRRVLNLALVKARLARALARKVVRESVDAGVWKELLKEGVLTKEDDRACRVEQPVEAHIYVSDIAEAA